MFSFSKSFVPTFSVIYENGLVRKLRLISDFMMSQTGKQIRISHILQIHIFPNIVRSNDNAIWSVNRTQHKKHFSSEIMQKMRQED